MRNQQLSRMLTVVFTAAAIATISATSASAAVFTLSTEACSSPGENAVLCYEKEGKPFELTGEQSVTFSGGKVVFTVLTSPVQKIECEKSEGSGTIQQKEPLVKGVKTTLTGKLKYKGCKLITEPSKKCVVNNENETKELLGTFENEGELKLIPAVGTVFIEITYSNNGTETCPATFKGTHAVTGSQTVEIKKPDTFEETKSVRAIGETLEFFSVKAELSQELTTSFTGLGDKVVVVGQATEPCEGTVSFSLCLLRTSGALNEAEQRNYSFFDAKSAGTEESLTVETVIKPELKIKCTSAGSIGFFFQKQPLSKAGEDVTNEDNINFSGCTAEGGGNLSKCTVAEYVMLSKSAFSGEKEAVEMTYTPREASGVFGVIKLTGTECPAEVSGEHNLTGSQKCKFEEAEKDKGTHTVICQPGGSALKFGAITAKLQLTQTITLFSEEPYSIELA